MKLKAVLTVSAIYQAIVGVGMILVPRQFGIDAVPPDASPALIAFLRIFGGPMLGIAVLNGWLGTRSLPQRETPLSLPISWGLVAWLSWTYGVCSLVARARLRNCSL